MPGDGRAKVLDGRLADERSGLRAGFDQPLMLEHAQPLAQPAETDPEFRAQFVVRRQAVAWPQLAAANPLPDLFGDWQLGAVSTVSFLFYHDMTI